jgi:hypothetical protein
MHNTLGASGKRREDGTAEDMQVHLAARRRIRRDMGSRLGAFFRSRGVERGGGGPLVEEPAKNKKKHTVRPSGNQCLGVLRCAGK